MNLKDAIKKLIKDNNSSYARLAEKLGYKKATSISNIVIAGDTKVSILMKICDELDYDIVIKPRGGDKRAERTVLLDKLPDREDERGKWREKKADDQS